MECGATNFIAIIKLLFMGRRAEVKSTNSNPAEQFLSWSSQNKTLQFWDKEKKENVSIKLPFTFLYLAERTTVKGYDANAEAGIYANEVKFFDDELVVKNFANKQIAQGKWNDISATVDKAGGKFAKSIYCMTKKGTLINITLWGGSIGEWFEFTKKTKNRLPDEWVTVAGVEERKKGATTYYVPVFKFNKSLSEEEGAMADKAYEVFEEFENGAKPRKGEVNTYPEENLPPVETYDDGLEHSSNADDDGLPF